ncbi:phosphocarrier protein [Saccharopolyspora erythraea NRRL 2338]|uniref:Phosphocarrier protein HPr n=2 Tax=Saccharopolyspora erythraea TaxID=1836 RepID=A4FC06_SACEN|nr:HPr family phosphocarrier protein [Saccharopolyspora erythraea]EQD84070.1 phosphotransferase [Saccharopolyspora erythraea D]PFG95353.1 phosphocarrier protein [Saccharopolyspora erythraea NRRL 2338]QRK91995.1 HPr family phosphocarrier protein [Saccharopolyspora erythraea]CAM01581.1 phosphocarrier, HPr family [Saccharopolyspora erythraea NRRL 2338]
MQRRVTIASAVGLHARPASLLSQAAGAQPVAVRIAKVTDGVAGEPVDAASVLGLMTLNAQHGDEVELSAQGDTAESVLDELVSMLSRDLDNEPVNA